MSGKKRLGEILLAAGVIDETQLLSALGHQRKWGVKLGQALVDLNLVTETQIVTALARKFGYPVVAVSAIQPTPALDAALKLVPRDVALKHTLLPVASDTSSLTVVMSDPSNVSVIDEIAFRTGRRVKVALAGDREIAGAVRRHYFGESDEPTREAIPIDVPAAAPLETTRDPFAAMPDHIREGYFRRPAHTVEEMEGEPVLATDLLVPDEEPAAPAPPGAEPGELLRALDALARGEESALVTPARLAAALARILIRRGAVSEAELLDELSRPVS